MRSSSLSSDLCSSDLTRYPHRLALVRQRILDPVKIAVRDRDPAGSVDVRALHVAQADLEVETPGLEARRVQDALVVDPGDPLEIVVLAVVPAADHTLVVDLEHHEHAAVVARHRYRDVLTVERKQHALEFGVLEEILDRHFPCRDGPGKDQQQDCKQVSHWWSPL